MSNFQTVMSSARRIEIERILRKVRFSDANFVGLGDKKEAQCTRIILACKSRLTPIWNEEARVQRNADFERRYANDTAINYYSARRMVGA